MSNGLSVAPADSALQQDLSTVAALLEEALCYLDLCDVEKSEEGLRGVAFLLRAMYVLQQRVFQLKETSHG